MYKKDSDTQSKITNTQTGNNHPKRRKHRKTNRRVVRTENNFKKGNKEAKTRFFPKRNFCFRNRSLTNGEISQEIANQDTKGVSKKASIKRSEEK